MTLAQRIAQLRADVAAKLKQRNTNADELNTLRSADEIDEARVTELRAANVAIDAEVDILTERIADLEAEKASNDAADRLSRQFVPGAERPNYDEVARVTSEPRTYTRESARKGGSFFADAYRAQFGGDLSAQERLARHQREVQVEGEMTERATSGSFSGLVIPQYLPDEARLALRAGRPLANIVNHQQLPAQGMNILIQRETTATATAIQTAENTAVQNTDSVWTDLTIPVRTIAGQQDVSRQALERGALIDALVYESLARAYAANLDNQLINGSGASGQILGILNTAGIGAATAFGAVPSVTNFGLKVAGQIAAVAGAGAGLQARALVMHPRRWGWLTGQVDSSGRPVVQASNVTNFNAASVITEPGTYSGGDGNGIYGTSFVGVHNSGLPVLTDINIPTNVGTNVEDVVLALDTQQVYLWEDGDGMPRELRFEQTTGGSLTTKLVVYGYVAASAGMYPGATGKVGGLDSTATFGLVAPAF